MKAVVCLCSRSSYGIGCSGAALPRHRWTGGQGGGTGGPKVPLSWRCKGRYTIKMTDGNGSEFGEPIQLSAVAQIRVFGAQLAHVANCSSTRVRGTRYTQPEQGGNLSRPTTRADIVQAAAIRCVLRSGICELPNRARSARAAGMNEFARGYVDERHCPGNEEYGILTGTSVQGEWGRRD